MGADQGHAFSVGASVQQGMTPSARGRGPADVAVIGAGPQGMAVAAHLRHVGADTQVFGNPMGFWKHHMPARMLLRSMPRASSISDPLGAHALGRFEAAAGRRFPNPIPIEDFIAYGSWFQREVIRDVDPRRVSQIDHDAAGFRLTLEDGDGLKARRVVVAAGIDRFARVPRPFAAVPGSLASHTFMHRDLGVFAGQRVVVVGAGQSALESAALLHEGGAAVEMLIRAERIRWLAELPPEDGNRIRERVADWVKPPTGVGPPGLNWVIAIPDLYRSLPPRLRSYVGWRAIPPAGADWLRPRLKDVTIRLGRSVERAVPTRGGLRVILDDGTETTVDHAVLGSGYRPDVSRYPFLPPALVGSLARADGYPILGPGFESSVPGLHFVGAIAAHSFGPIMRFVVGSGFAGREVTRAVTGRTAMLDPAW